MGNNEKGEKKEMKNGKRITLHSLQALQEITYVPPLDLPSLPDLQSVKLEELEEYGQKAKEMANQVRNWILSSMHLLDTISNLSREAKEIAESKYDVGKIKEELQRLLENKTPAYRRAAYLGLLQYELARDPQNVTEMEELWERLVKKGIIMENPATGELRVYKKAYSPSPKCAFGPGEVTELKVMLSNLLNRVWRKVGMAREEKTQLLLSQADIAKDEFLNGIPGKYAVSIPPEKIVKDGQPHWRGGGTLLLKSDGKSAIPLDASGAIENGISEARRLKVHLLISSLRNDSPPSPEALDEERRKKVQLLWYLIQRGLQSLRREEQFEKDREEMASRATLSMEEFMLEKKLGVCLLSFEGVWLIPGGSSISPLFFLIERREDGKIALVETPQHIAPFFTECWGEWKEEEKFRGIPYPLNAVLQAVYGVVTKTAKIAAS